MLSVSKQTSSLSSKLSSLSTFTLQEPRTVEIERDQEFGLGISIVGGRQDENGQKLHGIYIKHVLETSPAGIAGSLVTGDQILEVQFKKIILFLLSTIVNEAIIYYLIILADVFQVSFNTKINLKIIIKSIFLKY